jgi:hypothetical protein
MQAPKVAQFATPPTPILFWRFAESKISYFDLLFIAWPLNVSDLKIVMYMKLF